MVGISTKGNSFPKNGISSGARNPHLASWHAGGRRDGARPIRSRRTEQAVDHFVRLEGSTFRLNIDQQARGPVEGDRSAMIMAASVGKILETATQAAHAVRIDQVKMLVFSARHQ